MNHSNIVGGSTAKRVINCPAEVFFDFFFSHG
jgi:hypothetical protein